MNFFSKSFTMNFHLFINIYVNKKKHNKKIVEIVGVSYEVLDGKQLNSKLQILN